jgi:hypothetical protein
MDAKIANLFREIATPQFTSTTPLEVALQFAVAIVLALTLAQTCRRLNQRNGADSNLSANQFIIMTLGTVMVINAIQFSIALSLGFLAALSLVRFRSRAIESEELVYVFLAIAVGLGLGAGEILMTVVGFALIIGFLWLLLLGRPAPRPMLSRLTVKAKDPGVLRVSELARILRSHASVVKIQSVSHNGKRLEAVFEIAFDDVSDYDSSKEALSRLDGSLGLSLVSQQGILV